MRPLNEDPSYQDLLRREQALTDRLIALTNRKHAELARDPSSGGSIQESLALYRVLNEEEERLRREHRNIAREVWNLKASWR